MAEALLESILNNFGDKYPESMSWTKDAETPTKGYVIHDDGAGGAVYIVTIEEGKVVPT